jgi:hypothetical protein
MYVPDVDFGAVVQHARRAYPHEHATLGFFLARLRKPSGADAAAVAAEVEAVPFERSGVTIGFRLWDDPREVALREQPGAKAVVLITDAHIQASLVDGCRRPRDGGTRRSWNVGRRDRAPPRPTRSCDGSLPI